MLSTPLGSTLRLAPIGVLALKGVERGEVKLFAEFERALDPLARTQPTLGFEPDAFRFGGRVANVHIRKI